jgi:microcystin-dependent protein
VQSLTRLHAEIMAAGVYGSTITAYRTTLDGNTYSGPVFTASRALSASGSLPLSVTVTDSRGRTATHSTSVAVLPYSPPSVSSLTAERCNAAGTQAQGDGTNIRFSAQGTVSGLEGQNTAACAVYYRLSTASAWVKSADLPLSGYSLNLTDRKLSQTFDTLLSYDVMVRLSDRFNSVDEFVSVGTKQVTVDFYRDGTGVAFGKLCENAGALEVRQDWGFYTHGQEIEHMLVDVAHPVGSVIQTASASFDPETLWPWTTWRQLTDVVLFAAGGGQTLNATGGEAAHSILVSELPVHTHAVHGISAGEVNTSPTRFSMQADGNLVLYASDNSGYYWRSGTGTHGSDTKGHRTVDLGETGTSGQTGSGSAMSLMPPFLAVNTWLRLT